MRRRTVSKGIALMALVAAISTPAIAQQPAAPAPDGPDCGAKLTGVQLVVQRILRTFFGGCSVGLQAAAS